MLKVADGLLSGRYSVPAPHLHPQGASTTPVFQLGLKPTMFKALIGKGHEEFSTMRQQDSEEFLSHLVKTLRMDSKKRGLDPEMEPIEAFRFGMEQRIQCEECKRVRYRVDSQDSVSVPVPAQPLGADADGKLQYAPVDLTDCLDVLTGVESLEYHCPSCNKTVVATKLVPPSSKLFFLICRLYRQRYSRFSTFPNVLVVHAKKFQLVNWVPQKLGMFNRLYVNERLAF